MNFSRQSPNRRTGIFFGILLLMEIVISILLQITLPRSGDIGIHINTAKRILLGETLYCDILNVGLPLQFYIRIPGVMLADWLHLNPMTVAIIFDDVIGLLALSLIFSVLRNIPFLRSPEARWLMMIMLVFIVFVMVPYNLIGGEKEYFFWLLTLPYFLLAGIHALDIPFSKVTAVTVGLVAAIGFCFKPFFLLPLLLVELYLCYRARSWRTLLRPECVSCLAFWGCYMAWVFFAFPCYRTVIAPLLPLYYEDRWEASYIVQLYFLRLTPFVLSSMALGIHPGLRDDRLRPFFEICFLALFGYLLCAVLQMKDSVYHLFPPIAMSIFVCTMITGALYMHRPRSPS